MMDGWMDGWITVLNTQSTQIYYLMQENAVLRVTKTAAVSKKNE